MSWLLGRGSEQFVGHREKEKKKEVAGRAVQPLQTPGKQQELERSRSRGADGVGYTCCHRGDRS